MPVPPEAMVGLMELPVHVKQSIYQMIDGQKQAQAQEAEMINRSKEADAQAKIASAQYKLAQIQGGQRNA
jgi:hypothetical protein